MTADEIRAALKASGFTVRTTMGGHSACQTFPTIAQRDAYVARAQRLGAVVEVSDDAR